jgi:hypothetical protein
VSIGSDYRLDDRGPSPAEVNDLSSNLCAQTSSEAHPASCTVGAERPFPGVKRGRGVTLSKMRSYTSSPPFRLHGDSGTALL